METTETELASTPHQEPVMILNQEAQYYLQQAGKWAAFLGIVGFIFTGLIAVEAVFIGSIMSVFSKLSPNPYGNVYSSAMSGVFTIYFLLIGILYFFFSLYLYQFGSKIKQGIAFIDEIKVTAALGKLKSFLKLWGILTIILLAIIALVIVGVVIAGVGAASMMH